MKLKVALSIVAIAIPAATFASPSDAQEPTRIITIDPQGASQRHGRLGERGETGRPGVQGPRGERGFDGFRGDRGDRGEKGIKGIAGKDLDIDRVLAISSALSMPVWLGEGEKTAITGSTGLSQREQAYGMTGVTRFKRGVSGFVGGAIGKDGKNWVGKAGGRVGW